MALNHLRKSMAAVGVLLALQGAGSPQGLAPDDSGDDEPPPLSGQELLAQVRSRLPATPVRIDGDLTVRRRRGVILRTFRFHALLDLGASPALAQYTIMDAFGNDLEQFTVVRRHGTEPHITYAVGRPLTSAAAPPMSAAIQQTDIRWTDLTLEFLWWPGGVVAGRDEVRGRPCYIVEIDRPAEGGGPAPECAAARLWIDEQMHMLIQAELLDARRQPVRRLWVSSFKKVNDQWMIKDMEVETESAVHRTRLTIRDVDTDPAL